MSIFFSWLLLINRNAERTCLGSDGLTHHNGQNTILIRGRQILGRGAPCNSPRTAKAVLNKVGVIRLLCRVGYS